MEAGLLIFVVVVLLLFTGRGWWRGFLRTALGMLAVVLAVAAAVLLSPAVTRFLRTSTPLYDTVHTAMAEMVGEAMDLTAGESLEAQEQALANSSLPGVLKDTLLENNNEGMYQMLGVDSFLGYVSKYLAGVVVNICGVLLTFVLSFVILRLAFLLLGTVGNLPGIHLLNKIGGGILGFFQGLVLIWLFCFLVTVFSGTSLGQEMLQTIEKNSLLSMVYDGCLSLGNVLNLGKTFL